jgi:hypothetical protein
MISALHAIEARAGALFADHGFPLVGDAPVPLEDFRPFRARNRTFVAVARVTAVRSVSPSPALSAASSG